MKSRTLAFILVLGACACNDELTTRLDYVINPPDPLQPVYELATVDIDLGVVDRSSGAEGQPVLLPARVSAGYDERSAGTVVQLCAVGRGADDLVLASLSDEVRLIRGQTVELSMTLEALEAGEHVPPGCEHGLIDSGPSGLP
jgi:hypothetical protein